MLKQRAAALVAMGALIAVSGGVLAPPAISQDLDPSAAAGFMELVRTARVESGSDALPVVQDRVCLNEAVYVLAVRGPSEETLAGASVEPETKAWGNTAVDNYLRRICEIEDPSGELLDLYNRETWPPRFCLPHDPVRVNGGSGNRCRCPMSVRLSPPRHALAGGGPARKARRVGDPDDLPKKQQPSV